MATLTPMMQQYLDIKENHKDCILFFRLGDFYEMFFEDAKLASKELEITLTARDCGLSERAPMCGVPFHAAESYISKLVSNGRKVAICEQVEDPSSAKGIVKRDVIKIVTPGTVTSSLMLDDTKNNYLMCIYEKGLKYGLAVVDISTGVFLCTEIVAGNVKQKLLDEIAKFSPSEIICNFEFYNNTTFVNSIRERFNTYVSNFNSPSQKAASAEGLMLEYLEHTQKTGLTHIEEPKNYSIEDFMLIDMFTRRNLELTETIRERSKKGSLLWVLDKTQTSMGARMLRKWIEQPLIYKDDIEGRLDAVDELLGRFIVRMEMMEILKKVHDIERLAGKLSLGNVNCRDLLALKNSIAQIPYIKQLISDCSASLNTSLYTSLDVLEDVYELIEESINEDAPIALKEGNIIKSGFDSEIDSYRKASLEGKDWLAALEQSEKEKTGIKNLKVGFNRVFGYYIEVTKSHYSLVPEGYIRKQTLANCERFITDELKKIEDAVLGAEERLIDLEYKMFLDIKDKIASQIERIKTSAEVLANLDCLCSLAYVADRSNYVRPAITTDGTIEIVDGRHPVVERAVENQGFVPNDTTLDTDENRFIIITGPNMAGKSTFMRQVALIVLMAQIGSFVPAKSAAIGVVDRIFTRIGASDDLAAGQSTFMVEMSEVANILKNATPKSLLILDEIGRGTSTFDGLSIAWSVVEYISDKAKIGARTLFATHYHELTELEDKLPGVKNYSILVDENDGDIVFLRKIVRGGADDSYGIHVAKLAGIPDELICRANEILKELEKDRA